MSFKEYFQKVISEGRTVLTVHESKEILANLELPVNASKLATSAQQVKELASEIGFPCVMKIVSKDVVHKTDFGGVVVGVRNEDDAFATYNKMIATINEKIPHATIDGVEIENMIQDGTEVIIGATIDPIFGKVLMFGLGGILVEILKDTSFRLIPISEKDAEAMLGDIKASKILEGVRGRPPVDKKSLVDILMKISQFVDAHDEIAEMDLNPVFALSKGASIVDARIVLKGS
ncbi:MAG: acetate--CoA ligase family protein [Candidatus Hodarchaeota archaeon]